MDLLMSKVVTSIGRITRRHRSLDNSVVDDREYRHGYVPPQMPLEDSNLVASRLPNGNHAPAIDFDLPVFAVPSSSPGHTHVYIEKEMSWEHYQKLLRVLVEVGLVESGYYDAAISCGETAVRLPGVKKLPRHECPACGRHVIHEERIGRQGLWWDNHSDPRRNDYCEMSSVRVTP